MNKKTESTFVDAGIILDKMISISMKSQNKFAEEDLGINGVNIAKARKSLQIPKRWFDVVLEKYGVTKEELCKPPAESNSIDNVDTVTGGDMGGEEKLFHQTLDSLFTAVKQWQSEENKPNSLTSMQFIQEFNERFPGFGDWLKKRRGGNTQVSFPEIKSANGNG